jgi:hypothetical protein
MGLIDGVKVQLFHVCKVFISFLLYASHSAFFSRKVSQEELIADLLLMNFSVEDVGKCLHSRQARELYLDSYLVDLKSSYPLVHIF